MTTEQIGTESAERKLPTINLLKPLIVDKNRILLVREDPVVPTSRNDPPKWLLPTIQIDGAEAFTAETLSQIVQSRFGLKVGVRGAVKLEEGEVFGRKVNLIRTRRMIFMCKKESGRFLLDRKKYSEFSWVLLDQVDYLPLEDLTRETINAFLKKEVHDS